MLGTTFCFVKQKEIYHNKLCFSVLAYFTTYLPLFAAPMRVIAPSDFNFASRHSTPLTVSPSYSAISAAEIVGRQDFIPSFSPSFYPCFLSIFFRRRFIKRFAIVKTTYFHIKHAPIPKYPLPRIYSFDKLTSNDSTKRKTRRAR